MSSTAIIHPDSRVITNNYPPLGEGSVDTAANPFLDASDTTIGLGGLPLLTPSPVGHRNSINNRPAIAGNPMVQAYAAAVQRAIESSQQDNPDTWDEVAAAWLAYGDAVQSMQQQPLDQQPATTEQERQDNNTNRAPIGLARATSTTPPIESDYPRSGADNTERTKRREEARASQRGRKWVRRLGRSLLLTGKVVARIDDERLAPDYDEFQTTVRDVSTVSGGRHRAKAPGTASVGRSQQASGRHRHRAARPSKNRTAGKLQHLTYNSTARVMAGAMYAEHRLQHRQENDETVKQRLENLRYYSKWALGFIACIAAGWTLGSALATYWGIDAPVIPYDPAGFKYDYKTGQWLPYK